MAQFTNFNATTPIQGPSNTYTEAPTKQRRSRWGPETIATGITCRNTSITAAMTSEQIDAYVLHLRIEEITHKLRINDIVSANQYRRSPSPEPQYDASGRRTNTHYRRHRERLEKERHSLIQTAMHTFPNYSPPQDYVQSSVRQRQLKEKVYIPVKDFPEVNFIGQLLGPRGRSLAEMSTNSRASIVIRGRGSVKEGRGRDRIRGPRQADTDDHQEPLHCLITADAQESVENAKALIHAVIENAIATPEYDNDRKRQQLRALAVANGTLRDDEGVGRGTNTSRSCLNRNMRAPQRTPPWRKANTTSLKEEDTIDLTCAEFLAKIKSD